MTGRKEEGRKGEEKKEQKKRSLLAFFPLSFFSEEKEGSEKGGPFLAVRPFIPWVVDSVLSRPYDENEADLPSSSLAALEGRGSD